MIDTNGFMNLNSNHTSNNGVFFLNIFRKKDVFFNKYIAKYVILIIIKREVVCYKYRGVKN